MKLGGRLEKADRKLLKLQKKAEKCLTREKAQKILKKEGKLTFKF